MPSCATSTSISPSSSTASRHDSGDPLLWAEKTIAHYLGLGIDPLTKTLVFSGRLDPPRPLKIYRAAAGARINVSSA